MKRTTKTVMSSVLAIATLFSASPVFADSNIDPIPAPLSGIITPNTVVYPDPYNNFLVIGTPAATLPAFNIPASYGWVKVWVQNNGLDTITVTVHQGTATGTVKMQFQVAPGQQDYRLASSPWSTGNHVVSISPSQGNAVNANLTIKLSTSQVEL